MMTGYERDKMHTQLIASTLTSLGFIAQITTGGILVSLNRQVNTICPTAGIWRD